MAHGCMEKPCRVCHSVVVLPDAGRGEMLKRARVSLTRDPCEPNWSRKVKGILARRKGHGHGYKRRRAGYGR